MWTEDKMKAVCRHRTRSPQSQSFCFPLEREARQDSTLPRGKLWFLAVVKAPVWASLFPKCEPHAQALRTNVGHRSLGQASGEECGPCLCLRKAGILESSAQTWKEQRPLCIPESIWSIRHPGSLNETTPDVSSCVRRTGDLASEGFTLSLLPKVRPQGPIWSPSSVLEQRKNATSSFFWHPTVPLYGSQERWLKGLVQESGGLACHSAPVSNELQNHVSFCVRSVSKEEHPGACHPPQLLHSADMRTPWNPLKRQKSTSKIKKWTRHLWAKCWPLDCAIWSWACAPVHQRTFCLLLCFENMGWSPEKSPPWRPLQIKTCRRGCCACLHPLCLWQMWTLSPGLQKLKTLWLCPAISYHPPPPQASACLPRSGGTWVIWPQPIHVTSLFAVTLTWERKKYLNQEIYLVEVFHPPLTWCWNIALKNILVAFPGLSL